MLKGLGIPYMGSKRKLAPKILTKIMTDNPNTQYIYDLFGGGASISLMALQLKQIKKVHYNEFNPAIVNLLKYIIDNGITQEFYKWVSREEFKKNHDRTDWYGGLLKTVWTFGNNQKAYLFGKDIEKDKKMLHKIVVDNDVKYIEIFKNRYKMVFDVDIIHNTFSKKNIEDRRTIIARLVKNKLDEKDIDRMQQLERIQQLQQLTQLEQLSRLEQLSISNLSYEQVEINTPIDETIIYLDPPYKDTASYNKVIDFKKLKKFIDNSPYKIYLSEYQNTYNMKLVKEYKHRGLLSGSVNKEIVEKLFWNRK